MLRSLLSSMVTETRNEFYKPRGKSRTSGKNTAVWKWERNQLWIELSCECGNDFSFKLPKEALEAIRS